MWKALVGFLVFAAIALFFIFKAGDKIDMQGEAGAHAGVASEHISAAPAAASTPAAVVDAAASASSTSTVPAAEASPAAASASASK